ncbi:hypothetical protein GCM10027065_26010 [Rhodanobacter koreensis]
MQHVPKHIVAAYARCNMRFSGLRYTSAVAINPHSAANDSHSNSPGAALLLVRWIYHCEIARLEPPSMMVRL